MAGKSPNQVSVLFVCLGNICRSTMAEGVFRSLVGPDSPYHDRIARVDSCGTGAYHEGDPPDERTMWTLQGKGVTDYTHQARQIHERDFHDFGYILAMDSSNLSNLERWQNRAAARDGKAQVKLFGEYSGTARKEQIQDPYYSGGNAFDKAYQQARKFSENFLREVFPDVE